MYTMPEREFFHTSEEYSNRGLEPYLEHVSAYMEGTRTTPVSRTISEHGPQGVTFSFSDNLLQKFLDAPSRMKKPYEVAIKYGFRGYSKGGKNGIFYQRDSDAGLIVETSHLIDRHGQSVSSDLCIQDEGLDALKHVKIVWHKPSGQRVVGVLNNQNNRILFLDFASY